MLATEFDASLTSIREKTGSLLIFKMTKNLPRHAMLSQMTFMPGMEVSEMPHFYTSLCLLKHFTEVGPGRSSAGSSSGPSGYTVQHEKIMADDGTGTVLERFFYSDEPDWLPD